jgi:hypothetical protein
MTDEQVKRKVLRQEKLKTLGMVMAGYPIIHYFMKLIIEYSTYGQLYNRGIIVGLILLVFYRHKDEITKAYKRTNDSKLITLVMVILGLTIGVFLVSRTQDHQVWMGFLFLGLIWLVFHRHNHEITKAAKNAHYTRGE